MIELGKTYTDPITGFKGVAISRTVHVTGCIHIGLQGKVDKDGKLPQAEFFDEDRIDPPKVGRPAPGGPIAHRPPTR